jgi:hypothetical protein
MGTTPVSRRDDIMVTPRPKPTEGGEARVGLAVPPKTAKNPFSYALTACGSARLKAGE